MEAILKNQAKKLMNLALDFKIEKNKCRVLIIGPNTSTWLQACKTKNIEESRRSGERHIPK